MATRGWRIAGSSRRLKVAVGIAALVVACTAALAAPATALDGGDIAFEAVVASLTDPVSIANAGDGTGRLFIAQLNGKVFIFDGEQRLAEPFLDIGDRVKCCGTQGILGFAFHPDYASTGFFYVDYIDEDDNTVIARFQVSPDPNVGDPASEQILLTVEQPRPTHNGAHIAFGPDGYLYIAMGDGGGIGDPLDTAQNLGDLRGKLLRIDVDGGAPYAIPPDNPFVGVVDAREEVWAYGLRHPWRFSFDRRTGDLWIADVGQQDLEEIDLEPAGSAGGVNYGWDHMEGTACYDPRMNCNDGSYTLPVLEYGHEDGNCSITGGYRYRGKFPALYGAYVYADYCSGRVWAATVDKEGSWGAVELTVAPFRIPTFGQDEAGELYVAGHVAGTDAVYRLIYTGDSDNDGKSDLDELAAGRNPAVNEAALLYFIESVLEPTP